METRDETSAGGLVVSGLAECVDANGNVDLSRLYVALISELIEHLAYADERKLARIAHDLLPDLARKEAAAGKVTPR